MYVVIISLYISNNIDSPVDVGGFAEPRKCCVSVLFPPLSKYQYTPGPRMGEPESPTPFKYELHMGSSIENLKNVPSPLWWFQETC